MQYDLTRPNSGRMIDYWLGGNHNFEVDRQLADQVARQNPLPKQMAQDGRDLTKRCVPYFYARGIRVVIDFGAGLPTCGNTHLIAHALDPKIQVVYSDIDPVTSAYGQEILSANPNAIYFQGDAANPRAILDAPEVCAFLGDERRVGIIHHSLVQMLSDDQVRASWQALYNWVAPGSFLSVSGLSDEWGTDPELIESTKVYARANIFVQFRSRAQYTQLIAPWRLTAEGIVDNFSWGLSQPPQLPYVYAYSMMLYK